MSTDFFDGYNAAAKDDEAEFKRLDARVAELEKALRRTRVLIHLLGAGAVHVYDDLQDDGDRCYLGSTNDADVLEQMKARYDAYRHDTGDMGPESALVDLSGIKTEADRD